jgi:hypothetical protein
MRALDGKGKTSEYHRETLWKTIILLTIRQAPATYFYDLLSTAAGIPIWDDTTQLQTNIMKSSHGFDYPLQSGNLLPQEDCLSFEVDRHSPIVDLA